jgi:site-specific recombinase XerD
LPIHPDLLASIKACEVKGSNIIGAARDGRQITGAAVGMIVKRAAKSAGLPSICKPHGLRKAMARRLADRGASTKEIQSVTGHKTLREIERYTADAEQRRLAKRAVKRIPKRRKRV